MLKMCPKCRRIINISDKFCSKCTEKVKSRYKDYDKNRDSKAVKFYNSYEWKNTRERMINLDNSICVVCLAREGSITIAETVHHIVELKEDYSKRCSKDNLISVCNSCHKKIHDSYNKGNISKKYTQKELSEMLRKTRLG